MSTPVGNFKRIVTIRYSLRSTRTVLKPISSSRAPFPTRPSTAPPRRYRQRRFHPPILLASFSSGSVHCRYKAFCDTWFCKKSIVDTIFRIGHWNKEAADKWELDRTQHPSGAADSRATTKAQIAQQARRDAHYALQRHKKVSVKHDVGGHLRHVRRRHGQAAHAPHQMLGMQPLSVPEREVPRRGALLVHKVQAALLQSHGW